MEAGRRPREGQFVSGDVQSIPGRCLDTGSERIRAIILAGTHSWGDGALEEVVPKPLIPIVGRPLISYQLEWLQDAGVRDVSLCANSDTRVLRRALGDGSKFGVTLEYYEDVMPRGPAGCVKDAAEHAQTQAALYIVVEGSVVPQFDLGELLQAHRVSGSPLTLVVTRAGGRRPLDCSELSPAGVYVFSRRALDQIPDAGYQDVKEGLIPQLHGTDAPVRTHEVSSHAVPRLRGAASSLGIEKWAVERMARHQERPSGYRLVGEAWVHSSVEVASTARLLGPMLIETGSRIEDGAMVIGPTTIGAGCVVGRDAVVSRSILWTGCRVGPGAMVDQSILTDGATVDDADVVRRAVCLPPSPRRGRASPGVDPRLLGTQGIRQPLEAGPAVASVAASPFAEGITGWKPPVGPRRPGKGPRVTASA